MTQHPLKCTKLSLLAMGLLVFQGTALSLTLRYARTRPPPQFLGSVCVIWTEGIKLCLCVGALMVQSLQSRRDSKEHSQGWRQDFISQSTEVLGNSLPMALPAGLFVMQQVLVIIAASNLDAVTFQICSQSFKIMPTALFAAWLLGQQLTATQWASLPVLAVGVIFVTLNTSSPTSFSSAAVDKDSDLMLGLATCAISGLSSAYAGVYFEKYVKGPASRSLTVRNLQLSIYGLPFSLIYMILKDGGARRAGGFMVAFDSLAWSVVVLQVFGGLIVAMVVKHADNILKNFANALAVIFTVLGCIPLFEMYPTYLFAFGALLVTLSVALYGLSPEQSAEYCAALHIREPQWLQFYRTSTSAQGHHDRCLECAGTAFSYTAALTLAIGCTATIWLVIVAKTQSVPHYSAEGGLQLMNMDDYKAIARNASLTNVTWAGGGR